MALLLRLSSSPNSYSRGSEPKVKNLLYQLEGNSLCSFYPGRAFCVLCRGAVRGNRGARDQRWETSEDLCSTRWGGGGGFSILKSAQVDLRSVDHVYKNQFGKHLDKLVKEETGGHYRSTLLGLIPQAHHGHHGRSRWDKDRQSPSWCDPSAANNFLKTLHIRQQGTQPAGRTFHILGCIKVEINLC